MNPADFSLRQLRNMANHRSRWVWDAVVVLANRVLTHPQCRIENPYAEPGIIPFNPELWKAKLQTLRKRKG